MLQESQSNKFGIIKPKKKRSTVLVRRFGVKRYTKINLVRNMKIIGINTTIRRTMVEGAQVPGRAKGPPPMVSRPCRGGGACEFQ
jgi:hypothetical protein